MTRIKFSNLLTKKQFVLVVSFFFILLYLLHYTFFTANYYHGSSPKRFEIERGETLNSVAEKLFEDGIIPNKRNFKIAAFIYGAEKKLRAARYEIPNGLNYLKLVELFLYGQADFLRTVKVFPGSTIESMASSLKMDALIDSASFIETARSKFFLDSFKINSESFQGYLLPGEYLIYERSKPIELIKKFHDEFKKYLSDSLFNLRTKKNYSLHEIVTLASIVEGETNLVSEMPTIAGVYYNRLKIGMKLQADPTIQYAIPGAWRRLKLSDLQIESPYNTYKYYGLPPAPINNPSREALYAALFPEEHDYLFFVADGNGGHKFSKNYSQHQVLVRAYRKWLETQKQI